MCGHVRAHLPCSKSNFSHQERNKRAGWVRTLLLLARLRRLKGREIWAPETHAPCDFLVVQRVPRSRPANISPSTKWKQVRSFWFEFLCVRLLGSRPGLGVQRQGSGSEHGVKERMESTGWSGWAGEGPEQRSRIGKDSSEAFLLTSSPLPTEESVEVGGRRKEASRSEPQRTQPPGSSCPFH